MKRPRVVIWLGVLVVVAMVIVVCGALLLPRLIDSRLIREKITSELAKKTAGRVTFGKIALLWIPRPTVVLEGAEFSFNEKAYGSISIAKIYPSIFYLLTGRWVVRRVLLQEPTLRIRLPESSAQPFDFEELEKQIRSALVRLTTELPSPRIDLSDGSAEIKIGNKAPVLLENIAARTVASTAELRFELRARSSLCERLRVEGKMSPESLASQLDIGVQRLKVRESIALLPLQISEYAQRGEATLAVKITSVGLRKVKAAIGGSARVIILGRNGGTAAVEAKQLKARITYEGGGFQVDVEQLDLGSPRLKASGALKIHPASVSARVNVRDVDIAEAGDLARRIVGDAERVERIFHYMPAGTIPEMSFASAGRSFTEMILSKNIAVSGSLRDSKIFIPGPDLELTNVTGSVGIAAGILEAKDIGANLGTTKGWDGKLKLGLGGKAAPFHLDVSVRASAPELRSLLLKLIHDETIREELLKVQNVEGELSGRLILGERLNAISPVVSVTNMDMSATYVPIPFPIAIRSGQLHYDQKIIGVENVQGSVGRSTFGALGATLHHDRSRQIRVDAKRVSLDLQQSDTLLRSFKDLPAHFEKLRSVRGHVELNNLTLTGAYDDPMGWTFASTGTFNQVEIRHADFPDGITLSRGKFAAKQGRILFSDTAAAMSDASLIAGGTFEYKKGRPIQFETSGNGTVGAQMTEWIGRCVELPEALKLRSPLEITAGRLAWRAGGDISFSGQVTVAGGPLLFLNAVKQARGFALTNLTIDDSDRRARITFQLAKDNLDLSFNGELTQQTIDRLFASFPIKGSSLRGDIQVSAALANPVRVSGRGGLSGSNLLIPFETDKVLLETFSIEAGGQIVQVQSANLRWGKSHLAVSGKVIGEKDILRVDMDVTGDQLDWEDFQRSFGRERKQRQQENGGVMSMPAVEGSIRLKTDRFTFERFNVSPLEMTVAISPSGIRADIGRGIACGITLTGVVDVAGKEIGLDLQLAATEAPLEPATVCLTNQQNDVKGTYSLTARVVGKGERDHLLRSLKGDFELSARNGEFIRSPGIDATFDYLNATGDFKVAFPDLDRGTFPYRFVGVKGRIEGKILIGDEIDVEAPLLNLSGQGKVDLEGKQIDGKGLIAVLKPVDEVLTRIPLVSSMLGGSLVGIPVRVTGSLERPAVTYLSPADVGKELLNMPLRILGMPMEMIKLFTPSGEAGDKNMTK